MSYHFVKNGFRWCNISLFIRVGADKENISIVSLKDVIRILVGASVIEFN